MLLLVLFFVLQTIILKWYQARVGMINTYRTVYLTTKACDLHCNSGISDIIIGTKTRKTADLMDSGYLPASLGTSKSSSTIPVNLAKGRGEGAIQPVSMTLLRAVGNALPPRHSSEQTLLNVDFILQHEETFPNMSRHWFLNRLVDPQIEWQVVQKLQRANESFTIIPFDLKVYGSLSYRFDLFEFADQIHSAHADASRGSGRRKMAEERMFHDKLLYTANVNGVRNEMLRYGKLRSSADYILPFDGNCFLTRKAWEAIQRDILSNPKVKYFAVPMDRLVEENTALLLSSYKPNPVEEPQLIFHRRSVAVFNPNLPYGRRNKVELLLRLGIVGAWHKSHKNKWDNMLERSHPIVDIAPDSIATATGTAGWVSRLYSGNKNAELSNHGTATTRASLRRTAISNLLDRLDLRTAVNLYNFTSHTMLFYNMQQLNLSRLQWQSGQLQAPMIRRLMELASNFLNEGPWSVLNTNPFDCGDNPRPPMWPKSNESSYSNWSRFYLSKYGKSIPGSAVYSEGSDQFDRTQFNSMQQRTTVLALAYAISGKQSYVQEAAEYLRVRFLDPKTKMNPNFTCSRGMWEGNPPKYVKNTFGTSEMNGMYFFLDAVRIVETSGALSTTEIDKLHIWFRDYLQRLVETNGPDQDIMIGKSQSDVPDNFAPNHRGLYFDIQLASVAAYCGNLTLAVHTLHRTLARLDAHVNSIGAMRQEECGDRNCEDFIAFALSGWSVAARIASTVGIDYWRRFPVRKQSKLCLAMEYNSFLLRNRDPCAQSNTVGDNTATRWWPLLFEAKLHCPHSEIQHISSSSPEIFGASKCHHPAFSGEVAPFWNLNLPLVSNTGTQNKL
jgi:hypothetical protein